MRPIAVELFAGASGLSLGGEQAGFDVKAAVDIESVHSAVHKFNLPHTAVLARPVEGLSGDQIRKAAGLTVGRHKRFLEELVAANALSCARRIEYRDAL